MHITFFALLSLILPLQTMCMQEDPQLPEPSMRLQSLFASACEVLDTKNDIREICWNPQGTRLAVACDHMRPFIIDTTTPKNTTSKIEVDEAYFEGWGNNIQRLDWNCSGKILALGALNQDVLIYDTDRKHIEHVIPIKLDLYQGLGPYHGTTGCPSLAWSPEDPTQLMACHNGIICTYSIAEDGSEMQLLSRKKINAGYPTRAAWNMHTSAMAYRFMALFQQTKSTKGKIQSIPFHPNSPDDSMCSRAIACHPEKTIIACGFDAGNPVWGIKGPRGMLVLYDTKKKKIIAQKKLAKDYFIPDLSFNKDGTLLTAAHAYGYVTLDAETLEEIHIHDMGTATCCEQVQWNPRQEKIAFANYGKLFITGDFETDD